jgi:hypothetical protein
VFFDLNTPELPVLERYLTEWGVAFERSVILDGTQGLGDPAYVVPEMGDHEIVTQMQTDNMMTLLYVPRPIDVLFESYGPRTVTPLLTTSPNSYAKPFSADAPITTTEREDGDESGPFPAAVLSEQVDIDAAGNATRSRVFFAATTLADDSALSLTNLLNLRFMNSVAAYMNPSEDSVNIAPREMPGSLMNIPLGTAWVVMILLVAVLPLCLFGGGLAVWLRRRHL